MAALALVRHATVVIELGGQRVLVDPMLDARAARDAIANTPEPRRNPLVDLPDGSDELLDGVTTAIVTHLHEDHLDQAGSEFLAARAVPVQGQSEDQDTLHERGVGDVGVIGARSIGDVGVERTGGRHARGDALAEALGPVSGAVLSHGDMRLYVAGDTVRCDEFDDAMGRYRPTVVVLNAGGARFVDSETITMTADEVVQIAADYPDARFVAVHMDAINHCLDTRDVLAGAIAASGAGNVLVPSDGERVALDR
jgi:L-ascorbate metabolism protein UlaG (beta-lactamase superfamily)